MDDRGRKAQKYQKTNNKYNIEEEEVWTTQQQQNYSNLSSFSVCVLERGSLPFYYVHFITYMCGTFSIDFYMNDDFCTTTVHTSILIGKRNHRLYRIIIHSCALVSIILLLTLVVKLRTALTVVLFCTCYHQYSYLFILLLNNNPLYNIFYILLLLYIICCFFFINNTYNNVNGQ